MGRIARVPRKLATAWVDADEEAVLIALAVWLAFQLQAADRPAEIRTIQPLLAQALARAKDEGVVVKDASEYRLTDEEIASVHGCRNASEILSVVDELMDSRSPKWLMGWRDITNATNERTVIASVVPRSGIGNSMPVMLFDRAQHGPRCAALLANLNSMTLDYVARHKAGGVHLNFFIFKQLPIFAPDRYSEADLEFIVPRVLELTYTSVDLTPWASDLGYVGPPFGWESGRRAMLRAELDAYFARLYGLNRNDLRFVLDPQEVEGGDYPSRTFHRLKENEIRALGEYRTRRLVVDAWDRLERGDRTAVRDVAQFPLQPLQFTDSLAAEVWARPMADERAESGAVLGAILKAMAGAMPARQVRLTATLALQPRLLRPFLTADEAITWRRLVGAEADALPQGTSTVIPRVDGAWGAAVRTLRANGSLVEETRRATWAPGANLDALETAGWPDGRARFVLAVVERQATESIVRELPAPLRDWIDAQAA